MASGRAVLAAAGAAAAYALASWFLSQRDQPEDDPIVGTLRSLGQSHLFAKWAPRGRETEAKWRVVAQLRLLDANYPGGLVAYVQAARHLLGMAQRGENPLAGWTPSVPSDGHKLVPGTEEFAGYEALGLLQAEALGFVIPAGGLGERLGFTGVKFELPAESLTGSTVLQTYVGYILAVQGLASERAGRQIKLPLAIMTSDDTHNGISELLDRTNYYGLERDQVVLLKQEKVAALSDVSGSLALAPDSYSVLTKPHGHGDVHFLMHSTGTARRWRAMGVTWLLFLQDTSTLYMATFLATLGVSAANEIALNMVAMPRKAKEAIGALARLTHEDGRVQVANVEYNQLEPLLLATGFVGGDENDEETGFSKFPGNINEFVIHMDSYLEVLSTTQGHVDEFINPKFNDATRSTFKSPTRLECMMQDFAKTMLPHHRVGWTEYPLEFGYFPCKNDIVTAAKLSAQGVPPHSASTAEFAVYAMHAAALRCLGASVDAPVRRSYRGVRVNAGAAIVLEPSFAPCTTILSSRLPSPTQIRISRSSALIVRGAGVLIRSLVLDGALELMAEPGAILEVQSLSVRNLGCEFRELSDDEIAKVPERTAIRGFIVDRMECRRIVARAGEHIVVNE